MRQLRKTSGLIAATMLSFAAGTFTGASATGNPTTPQPARKTPAVVITMGSHSLTLSQTSAPSGVVSFTLANPSTVAHEIDIVRTALTAMNLPKKPSGQFNEHTPQAKVVKEAVKVRPGATRAFTAHLTTGHYVVIDNLPGHYRDGEAVDLTIT